LCRKAKALEGDSTYEEFDTLGAHEMVT
jgi:hypothetical protein